MVWQWCACVRARKGDLGRDGEGWNLERNGETEVYN